MDGKECQCKVGFLFYADTTGYKEEGWCTGQCCGGANSSEKAPRSCGCIDALLVGAVGHGCHNQRCLSVQIHSAQGSNKTTAINCLLCLSACV